VANKIVNDEGKAYRGRNHKSIEGLDLTVGGKGMLGYYDEMVPKRLQLLAKKHDPKVKVGQGHVSNLASGDSWPYSAQIESNGGQYWVAGRHPDQDGIVELSPRFGSFREADTARDRIYRGYTQPVHEINITPAMRESILRGQSAHARGGEVVDQALHAVRRHFAGDEGSYVDPMGSVAIPEAREPSDEPGIVDRAMSFLSQLNPVGSAEAASLPKAPKVKIPIPARQARPLSMEEIQSSFLPDAGRNFAPGPERDRLMDAYSKLASPFSPDPELRTMGEATAQTNTPKSGFETGSGSFFKVKPTTAKEDVTSVKTPFYGPELKQENPQSWDWLTRKYEGSPLISMGGDRSDFATLYGVNQDALPYPVKVHAGFKYMLEPNPNEVWGNAAIHSGLFDAAHADLKKAMKKDLPVLGVATPMGRQSLDSSRDFTNLLLAGIEGKGIHPKDLEAFANNLRTGQFMPAKKREAGIKAMSAFPGFDDMEAARSYLLDPRVPGTIRREFAQSMDAAKWRDRGFPEVGAYRIAATDPYTMDLPANMIGGRVVEIDPSLFARAKKQKLFDHFAYPASTYGKYVADVPFVQRHYAMPDAMERLMEKYNQERPGATKKAPKKPPLILHPFSSDTMGISSARKMFEEQKQVQELGDRVRSSLQFGEARRPTYGYRDGGAIEDHALAAIYNHC
jgi:hypothetical protein